MDFNEYQDKVVGLAVYPMRGSNLLYPAMGLAGEAGEAIDKVKKLWRNEGKTTGESYTAEQKTALALEIGDILWYIGATAFELGYTLQEIADMNVLKLESRVARGVVKGEGDNR